MKLEQRLALVTGGNRGIGFELCRQLRREGARVFLACRNMEKGTAAAATLQAEGVDVHIVHMDMSDPESVLSAVGSLSDPIDILINNAAVLDRGDIFTLAEKELVTAIHTNLIGPMILAKLLSSGMRERRWGRIVNITSGMGSIAQGLGSGSPVYRVSKAALNAFTICLARTLHGTGVLVNSVDPGWVRTGMGGPNASRSVEEGAGSVMWAVLIPDDGPTGGFFRDGKRLDW